MKPGNRQLINWNGANSCKAMCFGRWEKGLFNQPFYSCVVRFFWGEKTFLSPVYFGQTNLLRAAASINFRSYSYNNRSSWLYSYFWVIGADGLGNLLYLEGFQRNNNDITLVATVLILVIAFFIQFIGDIFTTKIDKR